MVNNIFFGWNEESASLQISATFWQKYSVWMDPEIRSTDVSDSSLSLSLSLSLAFSLFHFTSLTSFSLSFLDFSLFLSDFPSHFPCLGALNFSHEWVDTFKGRTFGKQR